jgi:GNAT superfamily N-acetyltransferase
LFRAIQLSLNFEIYGQMEDYTLYEINNEKLNNEFILLPVKLYKDDPNWVRPIDTEVKQIFNPLQNKMFRHGRLNRWILCNAEGKTIGRIAAFIDDKTSILNDQLTGGMGFFECINSQKAANMLFDKAKNWLIHNGMAAADAPVNFGSREKWWGLLIDGFIPPSYGMNYNPPYYKDLFENYGFKNYFNQYSYLRPINTVNFSPLLKEKAERIFKNPEYRFEHVSKKKLKKAAKDFCYIYNKAWAGHHGVSLMTEAMVMETVKEMKPIMDVRLIQFAYHNDEPIGFFIQIPELNQIIKYLDGKLGFYQKIKLFYLLKIRKICTRILGLIFGIIPEYRGKGIEGALVTKFSEMAFKKDFPYKDIDLTWVGDFNPVMMRFQQQIGGTIYKTHVTYRLLFDSEKQANEFERCPKMGRERT